MHQFTEEELKKPLFELESDVAEAQAAVKELKARIDVGLSSREPFRSAEENLHRKQYLLDTTMSMNGAARAVIEEKEEKQEEEKQN